MATQVDDPSIQINLVLKNSFREHLRREASKQRRTVSEIIRFALEAAYPYNEESPESFVRKQTRQT